MLTPEERWEQGVPHDPRSEKLVRAAAELDYQTGDGLHLKFGGDGDNGEHLMYLLDMYYEMEDAKERGE
jgi:hypothetical protein